MIVLMTRKSVKSIQNVLNETEIYLSNILDKDLSTVTKGAYTQAREKLNYTAFIELTMDIRDKLYEEHEYKKYKGYRLLGVDGSLVVLPSEESLKEEFGVTKVVNQYKDKNKEIVQGRVSLLYDLLNGIVIDGVLSDSKNHEIMIAKNNHFQHIGKDDLVIFDRGYPSYDMFATIVHKHKADFLMRTKQITYKEHTADLFNKNSKVKDIVVSLTPPTKKLQEELLEQGLPESINVRFIQVILPNGEVEVLVTSILDQKKLKTEDFKDLYFKRWKVETFYDIVKNRLSLENFTGLTPHGIKQDFYATMFISNMEALVTFDLEDEFNHNDEFENRNSQKKYQQKVNKSLSFNAIKNYTFELLYLDNDIGKTLKNIYQLIETNKLSIRPNRSYKRPSPYEGKNTKGIKSANFQKRKKKSVF